MTRDEKIIVAANEILAALSRMEKNSALTQHQKDCAMEVSKNAFAIKKELLA